MLQKIRKSVLLKDKKGQALVEYSLLVGGILLVALAAVAIFGHKTTDLMAASAGVLPGAHLDGNAPIVSGKIIETTTNDDGAVVLDFAAIGAASPDDAASRLAANLGVSQAGLESLVVEAEEEGEE